LNSKETFILKHPCSGKPLAKERKGSKEKGKNKEVAKYYGRSEI